MRVIAGTARRIRLDVASGSATRPFLEMARGALFNSLAAHLPSARVLDLYAGSGALGIEALSRGAATCCFVEADPRAAAVLRANLDRCGLSERSHVWVRRAEAACETLAEVFDLTFLDPPFAETAEWDRTPAGARIIRATERLLAPGGLVVLRLEDPVASPAQWGSLRPVDDRRYGRSRVLRYAREPEEGGGTSASGSVPGGGPAGGGGET